MTPGELLVVVPLTLLCTLFPLSVALLLGSIQRRLARIEQQLTELTAEQRGRAARGRGPSWSEPATPQALPARTRQERTPA